MVSFPVPAPYNGCSGAQESCQALQTSGASMNSCRGLGGTIGTPIGTLQMRIGKLWQQDWEESLQAAEPSICYRSFMV